MMKTILRTKIIVMLLILVSVASSRSQWINSITHVPANPASADTIYFYADLSFPSGTCNEHTQLSGVAAPYVYAGALHCLGMLTFICNYTDTFKIDPLPAGNYTFVFHLDAGGLPSPCTPGIVTGPTDSVQFTVSPVTLVSQVKSGKQDVMIFPNPAGNTIKLQMSNDFSNKKNKSLVIYSVEGLEIGSRKLEAGDQDSEVNISDLSNGIYFCRVITENSASNEIKLIIIK
jgi:type IX secretion system substrate protein